MPQAKSNMPRAKSLGKVPGQYPYIVYNIVYDIVYDIVNDIVYRMRYCIRHDWYLRILVSKAMAVYVEGIAPRFGTLGSLCYPLNRPHSHLMPPNVRRCPCGPRTTLLMRIELSSAAVHLSPCLSGISNSAEIFAPIHSASFVGSQRKTGCAVWNS